MPQLQTTITNPVGLHARPASLFVQTAKKFNSTIIVRHGARQANAKSIVQVLTLAVKHGSQVTLEADGDDSDQALQALLTLIESNFGESA
jgi:phosphocarrier protein HPr